MKIALVFGGPSNERGISLNSARSVADHLGPGFEITSYLYVDQKLNFFSIERRLLYSNTPDDFDFRLSHSAAPLSDDEKRAAIRDADVVFPTIHGAFGEDGEIQSLAASLGVPCVGSAAEPAKRAYEKFSSFEIMHESGIPCIASAFLPSGASANDAGKALDSVVELGRPAVIKPNCGGSSLGVRTLHGPTGSSIAALVQQRLADGEANADSVLQPWVDGTEFTVVVIEGGGGPVALIPLEIERKHSVAGEILSYRDKYLPTDDTAFHCPPRFAPSVIQAIRDLAERAFVALKLNDFARLDGWLLPDGSLALSDVNVISGMEQNSYLFIQAAQVDMSHREALRTVLRSTCRRVGLPMPTTPPRTVSGRTRVAVLFGGTTAERQVSVLSGSNVWLKLLHSEDIDPYPLLLTAEDEVWTVPYRLCLRHTVENIHTACEGARAAEALRTHLATEILTRLGLTDEDASLSDPLPRKSTLAASLDDADFVFIALHGGWGEDGGLQSRLDEIGIAYNGSGQEASKLCADKNATGEAVVALRRVGLLSAERIVVPMPSEESAELERLWNDLRKLHHGRKLIVKPVADGCSAGIVVLANMSELATYVHEAHAGSTEIAAGSFSAMAGQIVSMPTQPMRALLFEEFIVTDRVSIRKSRLEWVPISEDESWIEVTVGVVGESGRMRAMNPSQTVAREGVLSVEEKFMGGTGVNITPPPGPPLGKVDPHAIELVRGHMGAVANGLGLAGYARIDAFINSYTGETLIIEINSLPGLTPSTVLYHQALAEEPEEYPAEFLSRLVRLGLRRTASAS